MTVYLIHSISLLMSAVQVFCGGKMAVVAHLVGLEQLGYETDLGLTTAVRSQHYISSMYSISSFASHSSDPDKSLLSLFLGHRIPFGQCFEYC